MRDHCRRPAGTLADVDDELVPGLLRRVRRLADMSQRELARAAGMSAAAVGRAEAGGDLRVGQLVRIAALAGLRLALVDHRGTEVTPMRADAVRDAARRSFPAHLDTRHGDEDWWGGPHRPRLRPPRHTFDRDRDLRDARRRASAVPDDDHTPQDSDSLADRAAARRVQAAHRADERRAEAHRVWVAAGRPARPDEVSCTCPTGCEYAEGRNEDLSHATGCACGCDVG